ncbi:MAG: glycoside hydrolase family 2 TIM barrel-domain containing protein [Chloroflexota bacterium]
MVRTNRVLLNEGWRFCFEEGAFEAVTLPHTWNGLDTMEPDPERHYRRGVGVYERVLAETAVPPPNTRHFLQFEAAAMTARVTLDGAEIGRHAGGYTAFDVALPRPQGHLQVTVDNRPDPELIPSDMSDFFLYGGLTRNVWRYATGPVRLVRLHVVSELADDTAVLTLHGTLDGQADEMMLHVQLSGPEGTAVCHTHHPLTTPEFTLPLPAVTAPALWSPDSPALYTLTARLTCGDALSDEVVERIGLRHFDFPAGGPFYLNGERLLLRGTHRHEDWAGYGSAVPDELSRREMAQIKAAGFNFVRLGHYPQADAVLDACDELGLIVWEELPWCRGGVGGDRFKAQARTMLREMVDQHFNRPSLIFWGLGNELDWESEHPDTDDDDVYAFLGELQALTRELDPSRLTALRRYDRGADVVDVYSPSIWSGWYRGRYEDYEAVLRAAMARFPRLLHAEWGGDSHVGRHNSGPHLRRAIAQRDNHEELPGVALSAGGEARASLDGDWSESYMLDLMEWHLQVQQRLPNLAGTAQWVFKDFGTPLRPENPIPYINQKGLVARDGTPKDVYFLFQAYQTATPVCYIESPSWPLRSGEPGSIKRVRVYANCERVELYVNGRSHSAKFNNPTITPAGGLVWLVPLRAGDNELRAVGTMADGTELTHTLTQTLVNPTNPEAVALRGGVEWVSATAVCITVQLVNGQGTAVLNAERRVQFQLEGPGQLVTNQGTPDGSRLIETANGRAAIRVENPTGATRVIATAADLPAIVIPCLLEEAIYE